MVARVGRVERAEDLVTRGALRTESLDNKLVLRCESWFQGLLRLYHT